MVSFLRRARDLDRDAGPAASSLDVDVGDACTCFLLSLPSMSVLVLAHRERVFFRAPRVAFAALASCQLEHRKEERSKIKIVVIKGIGREGNWPRRCDEK